MRGFGGVVVAAVVVWRALGAAPTSPLSCAWGAHACRSCSAHAHANRTDASPAELLKMREFAIGAAKSWWVDLRGDHREQERSRFKAMGEWARDAFSEGEAKLPAVSLFGGADLQTLAAFFENAPSFASRRQRPTTGAI